MGEATLWAFLAFAAAVSALGGFALGRAWRPRICTPPAAGPAVVLNGLVTRSAPLDLLPGSPDDPAGEPLARCVPKSFGEAGLVCELLDCAAPNEVRSGREVTCFFAPVRLAGRKVNAFATQIASVDSAAEPPRMVLRAPAELLDIPRRRHVRKRVSDTRFVRVRLWQADAATSRIYFPEAAPDIWVNAYDSRHGEENAVTDISAGGLALEVRAALVPPGLEPGSPVVLKCSLFQFREKQFKPYWYAGLVRGISAPGGKMRRIAIGFTAVGSPDPAGPQGIVWKEQTLNEIAGGRT